MPACWRTVMRPASAACPDAALAEQVTLTASRVLAEENAALTGRQRDTLVQSVLFELAGLGPLEPLLEDETVSEIMVNGPAQVYVERLGRVSLTEVIFDDEAHLRRIIERILAPLGRRADESSPIADGRLADGSEVPKGLLCRAANPKLRGQS